MRVGSLLVCAALGWPGVAAAQHTKVEQTRIAAISPPPPVVTIGPRAFNRHGDYYGRHGYYYGGVYYPPPNYGPVPLLLLTDGRAFADFGYGYEQVVEHCGSSTGYSTQVVSASGANQPVVTQPTVSQPAPGAPSVSPPVSFQVVGHPCWSQLADGRLVAYP